MQDALSAAQTNGKARRGPGGRIILTDASDAKSRAAAVHVKTVAAAYERGALLGILDYLTERYWSGDASCAELEPYECAKLLLDGRENFNRKFRRDLRENVRARPEIKGRIDPTRWERALWGRLEFLLWQWCANVCRRPWWRGPAGWRRVVKLFEERYRGKPKRPRLRDDPVVITESGPARDDRRGWRGTALERKGTFHELIQDMALSPAELNEQTNIFDEQCAAADKVRERRGV